MYTQYVKKYTHYWIYYILDFTSNVRHYMCFQWYLFLLFNFALLYPVQYHIYPDSSEVYARNIFGKSYYFNYMEEYSHHVCTFAWDKDCKY